MRIRKYVKIFKLIFTGLVVATLALISCAHQPKAPRLASRLPSSTCLDSTPPKRLNFVSSKQTSVQLSPLVSFILEGKTLKVNFVIDTSGTGIYAKEHLGPKEFPYQYDVVEIFIAVNGMNSPYPYFEIELSPYNEAYQVLVENKTGKKKFSPRRDFGIETHTEITPSSWTAEIKIPLENLKWNGRPEAIIGNAYAVLGKENSRTYWGLTLPPTENPNFHKPEFFRPLLDCPSGI